MTQTLSQEQSEVHDAESKGRLNLKTFAAGFDSAELVDLANLSFLELPLKGGINSNPSDSADCLGGLCGAASS